jgi:hypothetical protein
MIFNQVVDHITKLYMAGLRQTTYLSGPPGIGKSACVRAASDVIRETIHDFQFRAIQMTVVDPLDFGGLPAIIDGEARRISFSDLVPQTGAGIILFDDLPTAPPLTQAAAYRTVYERDNIGADWMIVATGNRAEDRAAVQQMPKPLVSKMGWLEFEPDRDGWTQHMAATGGSVLVRAFMQHAPMNFVNFKPEVPGPFACPRTWDELSKVCNAYAPAIPPFEAIKGWVGEGPATEFVAFASMAAELVSVAQILANPDTARVPTNPGALYVVTTALSSAATNNNFDRIVRYLDRVEPEFAVYTVRSALAVDAARLKALPPLEQNRYQRLQKSGAFIRFCAKFQDLLS